MTRIGYGLQANWLAMAIENAFIATKIEGANQGSEILNTLK